MKWPMPAGAICSPEVGSSAPGAFQDRKRSCSCWLRPYTELIIGISRGGTPPMNSIFDRSTKPRALSRSASSGRVSMSVMECVAISCPTPTERFRRVKASIRSTNPDDARRMRHSSSMMTL